MLGDKLNRFSRQIQSQPDAAISRPGNSRYRYAADFFGGELVRTDGGVFIKITVDLPSVFSHGDYSLGDVLASYPLIGGGSILNCGENSLNLTRLLFFDMETTGLSGGSGTVPFLIGFGSLSDSGFQVRQYLLPDYPDEAAMLAAARREITKDSILVSYNGRAFDLPILSDRLILHRIERNLEIAGHIDLLHPVRRLFKRRLRDCSLGNIEREILRYYRFDDIPGYLVPSVYFNWLANGEMEELRRVNKHNLDDIVSMLFIMHHMALLAENPSGQIQSSDDLYSFCRVLEQAGDREGLYNLIEASREMLERENRFDILFSQALSYKRGSQTEKAEALWLKIAQTGAPESYSARLELAKFYEHRLKDFAGALKFTLEAREECPPGAHHLQAIEKRINRLHRKLSR